MVGLAPAGGLSKAAVDGALLFEASRRMSKTVAGQKR